MKWLSVDPGEDTGWALWEGDQLVEAGTLKLQEFLDRLWDECGPCVHIDDLALDAWYNVRKVVCEDWALYPWKLKEMGWDKCRTARGIGAIELICRHTNVQIVLQPASIKESAKMGGVKEMFLRPFHENRHANDAIMHGFWHIQRSRASALSKNAESQA